MMIDRYDMIDDVHEFFDSATFTKTISIIQMKGGAILVNALILIFLVRHRQLVLSHLFFLGEHQLFEASR